MLRRPWSCSRQVTEQQAIPTAQLAISASWYLGQQPPWRSCFWKPEQPWRCPASSPSSGRCCHQPNTCSSACNCSHPDHLALCCGSNEIPAPVMCRQEQEGCFLLRGGCQGCAAGLEGHWEAGRAVSPSQKQGARSVVCVQHVLCREAGMQELSLASHIFNGQCVLLQWFPAQGAVLISSPVPPALRWHRIRSLVQELQLVSDSCFRLAMLLAPCPVSWLAHRDCLLPRNLFPLSLLTKAWSENWISVGWLREAQAVLPLLFQCWVRTWLFLPPPASMSRGCSHYAGCWVLQVQVLPAV